MMVSGLERLVAAGKTMFTVFAILLLLPPMKDIFFFCKAAGFALLLTGPALPAASDWPSWRGPHGDGTTTSVSNLPDTWGSGKNIKWAREMPAWSGSSPVVWGDRIYVNSPSAEERRGIGR